MTLITNHFEFYARNLYVILRIYYLEFFNRNKEKKENNNKRLLVAIFFRTSDVSGQVQVHASFSLIQINKKAINFCIKDVNFFLRQGYSVFTA